MSRGDGASISTESKTIAYSRALLTVSAVPLGAVTAVGILLFLRISSSPKRIAEGGIIAKLAQFDPLGTSLFVPSVICLLLALQWGGTTYAWSDGRIIALFVLFGILLISFGAVQIWMGESATGDLVRSKILWNHTDLSMCSATTNRNSAQCRLRCTVRHLHWCFVLCFHVLLANLVSPRGTRIWCILTRE